MCDGTHSLIDFLLCQTIIPTAFRSQSGLPVIRPESRIDPAESAVNTRRLIDLSDHPRHPTGCSLLQPFPHRFDVHHDACPQHWVLRTNMRLPSRVTNRVWSVLTQFCMFARGTAIFDDFLTFAAEALPLLESCVAGFPPRSAIEKLEALTGALCLTPPCRESDSNHPRRNNYSKGNCRGTAIGFGQRC
jgi:hypothetical protein